MPNAVGRGCVLPVLLTWVGIFLGLVCFGASVQAAPAIEHRILGLARMPSDAEITAYTTAICGAVITVVNTLLFVWQKLVAPHRARRRRRAKSDAKPGSDGE